MPRGALALALAVLVGGALAWWLPWATDERDAVVAAPSTTPLFRTPAVVEVPPGETACVDGLAIAPRAEEVRFIAATPEGTGPPLAVTLAAPGYRAEASVRGGYSGDAVLAVPFRSPEQTVLGRLCIANEGEQAVGLVGTTEERTLSRVATSVDGEQVGADLAVAFYRLQDRSIVERLPLIAERMAAFRPGLLGEWLAWSVGVLVLFGLPGLPLFALRRASAQRPGRPEDGDVVERRADQARVDA